MGTDDWASQINWPGQTQFNNAASVNFTNNGDTFGSYKAYSTLTHVIINGAGHMVPFNQPQSAWNLLYTFINKGFNSTAN